MKLLIVTQKVYSRDPILGFFCKWITEFSKKCEKVTVIGQYVLDTNFADNVVIESLLKEKDISRPKQVLRFFSIIHKRQKEYDAVLVHMTPIWIAIGFIYWWWKGKRMFLWYEAKGKRWPLIFANRMVKKIFSASHVGMPIRTNKSVIVGHGIDTDFFKPVEGGDYYRDQRLLSTVGRITPAKRLEIIIDSIADLPGSYHLVLLGIPLTIADRDYEKLLENIILKRNLKGRVIFRSNFGEFVLKFYRETWIFLHASTTGLDKALLEAMSCECLVVSCSEIAASILPAECVATPVNFSEKIKAMCALAETPRGDMLRKELREYVVKNHNLSRLIDRLIQEMS